MTKRELLAILQESLANLYQHDGNLILNQPREESLNHRMSVYLERIISAKYPNFYHFDTEYDTDRTRPGGYKRVIVRGRLRNIRPDDIVHQRTHNEQNLLVLEAKLNRTNLIDRDKVIGLMQPPYNYKYGILLSYFPTRAYFGLTIFYCYRRWIWEQEFAIDK